MLAEFFSRPYLYLYLYSLDTEATYQHAVFDPRHYNHSNGLYNDDQVVHHLRNRISQGNDCVSGKYPISPFKKVAKPCV